MLSSGDDDDDDASPDAEQRVEDGAYAALRESLQPDADEKAPTAHKKGGHRLFGNRREHVPRGRVSFDHAAFAERVHHVTEEDLAEAFTDMDVKQPAARAVLIEGKDTEQHFHSAAKAVRLVAWVRGLDSADVQRHIDLLHDVFHIKKSTETTKEEEDGSLNEATVRECALDALQRVERTVAGARFRNGEPERDAFVREARARAVALLTECSTTRRRVSPPQSPAGLCMCWCAPVPSPSPPPDHIGAKDDDSATSILTALLPLLEDRDDAGDEVATVRPLLIALAEHCRRDALFLLDGSGVDDDDERVVLPGFFTDPPPAPGGPVHICALAPLSADAHSVLDAFCAVYGHSRLDVDLQWLCVLASNHSVTDDYVNEVQGTIAAIERRRRARQTTCTLAQLEAYEAALSSTVRWCCLCLMRRRQLLGSGEAVQQLLGEAWAVLVHGVGGSVEALLDEMGYNCDGVPSLDDVKAHCRQKEQEEQ